MKIFERQTDWRKPVIAQSEEVPVYFGPERTDERMESGILHAVNDTDYERIKQGMVCPQCLTPFPAPCGIEHLKTWRALTSEEWRPELTGDQLALIAQGCCPICSFLQTPEMLALQDHGVTVNESDQWRDEIAGFPERAAAYYAQQERMHRSTGAKHAARIGAVQESIRRHKREGERPR